MRCLRKLGDWPSGLGLELDPVIVWVRLDMVGDSGNDLVGDAVRKCFASRRAREVSANAAALVEKLPCFGPCPEFRIHASPENTSIYTGSQADWLIPACEGNRPRRKSKP